MPPDAPAGAEGATSVGLPVAALAAAVKANNTEEVRRVLAGHPELKGALNDPMPSGPFGATPLLGAVSRRNREMIDLLLAAGADINARSQWWAGSFGVLDGFNPRDTFAEFLIGRGAIVNAHAASRLDMLDRLDELVAANPELVHARGGDGQTPLHVAATVRIAKYLLDHGADIDARDIDHESTPAQYLTRDRQEVARYLVSRGCRTDLLMAAALGDLDLARSHLDANPDAIRISVSERDFPKSDPRSGGSIYIWVLGSNKTPHAVAREFGHEELFRLLMERSPDEVKLAVACELGDEPAVRSLLQHRPDVVRTLTDEDRRKVVDAAQNNNTTAVRLMLDAGWAVDARGQEGATSLHWAAFHGNLDMVREILRHNPPVDIRDTQYDAPPIGWAVHGSKHGWHCKTGNFAGTVEALLDAGAKAPSTDDLDASDAVRAVLLKRAEGNR